jgi:DNA-binding transcriptional MerR regulator
MSTGAPRPGFTIEQLADMVGMTPRNIRAHQARGLLPPPRLAGRLGYYDGHHVARLRLIKQLQALGLNLSAIEYILRDEAMFAAILQERRGQPGGDPTSAHVPLAEASMDRIRALDPELPGRLVELGLLGQRADGTYVCDAVSVAAGAALFNRDVPVGVLVQLQIEAALAARRIADLAATTLGPGTGKPPEPGQIADTQPLLTQLIIAGFEAALVTRLQELASPPADG